MSLGRMTRSPPARARQPRSARPADCSRRPAAPACRRGRGPPRPVRGRRRPRSPSAPRRWRRGSGGRAVTRIWLSRPRPAPPRWPPRPRPGGRAPAQPTGPPRPRRYGRAPTVPPQRLASGAGAPRSAYITSYSIGRRRAAGRRTGPPSSGGQRLGRCPAEHLDEASSSSTYAWPPASTTPAGGEHVQLGRRTGQGFPGAARGRLGDGPDVVGMVGPACSAARRPPRPR